MAQPEQPAPNALQGVPGQRPSSPLFELSRPTVIALLYLFTPLFFVSAIIGVVLAYVWRGEVREGVAWEWSHYTYHVRSFWLMALGLVGMIILVIAFLAQTYGSAGDSEVGLLIVPALVLSALPLLLAARCIHGLIRAQSRQPMPRPRSWLF